MKKEKEDTPVQYIERNVLVIIVIAGISAFFAINAYLLFKEVDPRAFVLGIPALIFGFQALWLGLNPFAVIYDDKFEIKRSFISNRFWYFIDIKEVKEAESGGFRIVYNDDETEKISFFGIRSSQKKLFRDAVNKFVCKSLVERD